MRGAGALDRRLPTGHSADCLIDKPAHHLRLVMVTSGTGAITAFGIAEEVLNTW